MSGDTGRLLITFLGLVSASLLPTISLIIGSMTSSGRSVLAVNQLNDELSATMDALFALFGLVGVIVAALVSLTIPIPAIVADVPLAAEVLARSGQVIVAGATALILMRVGQIPAILRRLLKIKHEIAVEEARRKMVENAPPSSTMGEAFRTHAEFGRRVDLQDLQSREPH